MNADRLLAHYERIADAPDAVPRLRRFILDLAVRGKLVEQDPNDEPASELLEADRGGKGAIVKTGKISKSKRHQPELAALPYLNFPPIGNGQPSDRFISLFVA